MEIFVRGVGGGGGGHAGGGFGGGGRGVGGFSPGGGMNRGGVRMGGRGNSLTGILAIVLILFFMAFIVLITNPYAWLFLIVCVLVFGFLLYEAFIKPRNQMGGNYGGGGLNQGNQGYQGNQGNQGMQGNAPQQPGSPPQM